MSACTQKDLREVSPHLTRRKGFLKAHMCPEMKYQIGVTTAIINIYLKHTVSQSVTREFIWSVTLTRIVGDKMFTFQMGKLDIKEVKLLVLGHSQ